MKHIFIDNIIAFFTAPSFVEAPTEQWKIFVYIIFLLENIIVFSYVENFEDCDNLNIKQEHF